MRLTEAQRITAVAALRVAAGVYAQDVITTADTPRVARQFKHQLDDALKLANELDDSAEVVT